MNKCLVFGANGYIGRHLVRYLTKAGHSVVPIGSRTKSIDNLLNYRSLNICNPEDFSNISFDVDYIFFFSGLTGTYDSNINAKEYVETNEIGLLNLLNNIKDLANPPQVVFPSSRLVYKGNEEIEICENFPKEAKTVYALNKMSCEDYLRLYALTTNIRYSVFRICVPFGNLFSEYSFGTVGHFMKQAKQDKLITIFGSGHFKRTFTYIHDIVESIAVASFNEKSINEIFNIGGHTYSLKEVATIIANYFEIGIKSIPWPENYLAIESGSTVFDSCKIDMIINKVKYREISDWIIG